MRDCFTPVESNEENRRGHGYFYAHDINKKKGATEAQNVWEAFFACDNHNLQRGTGYGFY